MGEGTEEMKRQIEFLIKQINSTEVHEEVDSDAEDGDEDEEVIYPIKNAIKRKNNNIK